MIRLRNLFVIMVISLQAGNLMACVSISTVSEANPPKIPSWESCGDEVYSREDEEGILENYFEYIHLYDAEVGQSFNQDQSGAYLLNSEQYMAVGYKAMFPNHMRLCIQEYKDGQVVFDDTLNTDGQGSWTLRRMASGQYVMRVIVKNMVIASYVLKVSE
jgi:hypothetical protein